MRMPVYSKDRHDLMVFNAHGISWHTHIYFFSFQLKNLSTVAAEMKKSKYVSVKYHASKAAYM